MWWGALKAKHYIFFWGGGGGAVFFLIQLCVCARVCVCSNIFSETTGPIETKFHVEPPWDRGRKFIQMVQVIIVNLCVCVGGGGAEGVGVQGFYHKCVPAGQGV